MNSSQPRQAASTPPGADRHWQRLSARMIWVDLAQSILSLLPAVIAVWVIGVDPGTGQIWPLVGLAAVGVLGAIADALRWVFTRYRITASHVELKTGVLLRAHRSIQRDRVRSVDIEAKLRHRLSGLRVVKIGAGQQAADGESALAFDALSAVDARSLHERLLNPVEEPSDRGGSARQGDESSIAAPDPPLTVFARFQPRWVVYNVFNIWVYVLALGFGWGAYWLLGAFGVNVVDLVGRLLDWDSLGWTGTAAVALAAITLIGAAGLAVTYFAEYWNFELARVRGAEGTMLRTRQGLLTTREVNRDENRIRGIQISEPVLWRWMGVSDTTVITTGLSMWSMAQPAGILPRGPVAAARRIASEVLDAEEDPFQAPLVKHPAAALRRRLWWATALSACIGLSLAWLAATGVLPHGAIWAAAVFWPCSLGAAYIAYRALGHAIVGRYLVTRSGLVSRATTVLQRSSVSTIVIRESLLQRRLGLRTVSTMTAAGYGGYVTPDIEARKSLAFALRAAPGVLEPFLTAHDNSELAPVKSPGPTRPHREA